MPSTPDHRSQLPVETVRDLLGIVRALYRASTESNARGDAYRGELEAIGRELRAALKLAKGEPDTVGHRAAWSRAERATKRLAALVDELMPLAPVLKAASRKIVG